MKPATQQMALKAALFVILAANVSWRGAKSIQASDFASNSELGAQAPNAAAAARPATPPAVRLAQPMTPPTGEGPKPDAAISSQSISTRESSEYKMICSVPIKIHFVQTRESTGDVVHMYVTNRQTSKDVLDHPENGTYSDIVANAQSKSQIDVILHDAIVESLKAQGKDCSMESKVATGPQSPTDQPQESDAERIARGLRNCTGDKYGNPLKNSARYQCNLAKLQSISLDNSSSDDDDEALPSDRISRANRSERSRRSRTNSGLAQVQALLRPLENSIRGLLISSNEDKRDEGESRLDDVVDALEQVKDTASNWQDERALSNMIRGLKEGYLLGEKVARTADERREQMQTIDDRMSSLRVSAQNSNNIYAAMQASQQLQILQMQRQQLQQSLSSNQDYLQLRSLNQQGLLDSTDFADFTADYNSLLGLNSLGALGGSSLMNAPSDVMQARQGLVNTDPRNSAGLTNMAYPSINYSALGLQNPAAFGAQNQMMPLTNGQPGLPNTNTNALPMQMPNVQTPYMQTAYPYTTQIAQTSPVFSGPMTQPMRLN